MSGIHCGCYGITHNWKDKGTKQHAWPERRFTTWQCLECKVQFLHYYHVEPDIFKAMRYASVPEICTKEIKND